MPFLTYTKIRVGHQGFFRDIQAYVIDRNYILIYKSLHIENLYNSPYLPSSVTLM